MKTGRFKKHAGVFFDAIFQGEKIPMEQKEKEKGTNPLNTEQPAIPYLAYLIGL